VASVDRVWQLFIIRRRICFVFDFADVHGGEEVVNNCFGLNVILLLCKKIKD